MIVPPPVTKVIVEALGLLGEKAVVSILESAIKRTREAELKRNKSLFQRIFSRGPK
jgi:hypothetical protein